MKKILQVVFFLIVVPFILFQLRGFALAGGDSAWIVSLVERPIYFFFRAPLVVVIHKCLWLGLRDFGWSPGDCVSLSSCLAGGFFFLALIQISSNWKVWLPIALSCLPLVFIGHQETYPWPFALTLWTLYLLRELLSSRASPFLFFSVLVIASFSHPMVFMVWPGVIWALRPLSQDTLRPLLVSVVVTMGLMIGFLLMGNAGGLPQRKWLLPLLDVGETLTRYPILSWEHWKELGWFYAVSMPFGLILLARFGLRKWHGWIGGVHVTVLVTVCWSIVWHPGMSYDDWDLFSWPSLFVNLAGGLAWSQVAGRVVVENLQGRGSSGNEKSPPSDKLSGDS